MTDYITNLAENQTTFEAKNLIGKFSMDGLASCAFEVETGSFNNDDS